MGGVVGGVPGRGGHFCPVSKAPSWSIHGFEWGCAASSGTESKLGRAMASPVVPSPSWWQQKEPLTVPLAYGSQTGFQARIHNHIKNKGRCTMWTSETPEESAWVLACWRLDPCGLSSPGRKRVLTRNKWGALASSRPPLFLC